ncbi:hypothetical protein C6H66_08530 [Photorhabdus hindustanensis]|uniref:Uncharacterized protein n=1 Tax=Photorhabdus hindustanensis TaxID=2918802 RepID=A0A2S8Q3L9_9GAMM|nr:hypothetical protein C6H66_08530 [Photorhabdus hindustanensis]
MLAALTHPGHIVIYAPGDFDAPCNFWSFLLTMPSPFQFFPSGNKYLLWHCSQNFFRFLIT